METTILRTTLARPTTMSLIPPPEHPKTTLWGTTFFHSETGTEGGYWAVQDVRGTRVDYHEAEDGTETRKIRWSYYGLWLLEDGDHLTIYDPESVQPHGDEEPRGHSPLLGWDGKVLWEGEIRLQEHPLFQEHAKGLWIHHDQKGVDRDTWAEYFFQECPCKLVTRRRPRAVGRYQIDPERKDGLFGMAEELFLMSDGTVRWNLGVEPRDVDYAPYELRRYLHHRRIALEERRRGR